jgi:hypothetical protein
MIMKTLEDYFKRVNDPEIENNLISNKHLFEIYKHPKTSNSVVELVFKEDNLLQVQKILKNYLQYTKDRNGHYVFKFPKLKIRSTRKRWNTNTLGAAFITAIEVATLSLLKGNDITAMSDAGELFADGNIDFSSWKQTFEKTADTIKTFIETSFYEKIKNYDIFHVASNTIVTDDVLSGKMLAQNFLNNVKKILKQNRTNLSFWCPADAWFVSKKIGFNRIYTEVKNISDGENSLIQLNTLFRQYFSSGLIIPISLKKIRSEPSAKVIDFNRRNEIIPIINAKILKLHCDLDPFSKSCTKEIGEFSFVNQNIETNNKIRFQIKCYPDRHSLVQTEITSLGIGFGGAGRGSKVPAKIMSEIMHKYSTLTNINCERIETMNYFGKLLNNFDANKIKEVCKMYEYVYAHQSLGVKVLSSKEFCDPKYLETTIQDIRDKNDLTSAKHLCAKIQGLRFLYLLLCNHKNLNDILTEMILGALKIGKMNMPYVLIS